MSTDQLERSVVRFLDLLPPGSALQQELEEAVTRVIGSGRYVLGPELEAFEAEYADYVGSKYCIGVGSGMDALTLLMRGIGVKDGDRVALPAHTFIATWIAVESLRAEAVLVDASAETMLMDPQKLEAAAGSGLDAILTVHLYGSPAGLPELAAIAAALGVPLVEDAAQAHGASVEGRRIGAGDSLCAWSFYPGKNLGALGDGGAVTTSDEALERQLRALRNYGSSSKYRHELVGVNSRLDEIQAAALRVKLRHLEEWNELRRTQAAMYLADLPQTERLRLPPSDSTSSTSAWHLFVIRTPHRDQLQRYLAERGIETLIHYPYHLPAQPAVLHSGWTGPEAPVAEGIAASCLSLPIGPHLSPDQQERVIEACTDFFSTL